MCALSQVDMHTKEKICYFVNGREHCAKMDMFNGIDSNDKLIGCPLHSFPLGKIKFKVFSLNPRVSRLLRSDNNFFIEQNNCIFTAYAEYLAQATHFFLSFCSLLFSGLVAFFLQCNAYKWKKPVAWLLLSIIFLLRCNAFCKLLCIHCIECYFIHVKRCIKIISCWTIPVHFCSIYPPYYNFLLNMIGKPSLEWWRIKEGRVESDKTIPCALNGRGHAERCFSTTERIPELFIIWPSE